MYSSLAYYIAKICVELPFDVFYPSVMGAILYYLIGFNPGPQHFFIFLLGNALLANTTVGIGMCFFYVVFLYFLVIYYF